MLRPITENRQDFDNIDYLNVNTNRSGQAHHGPKKKNKSGLGGSLSCMGVLWSLLSLISLVLSLVSVFMPYWIRGTLSTTPLSINKEAGLNNVTDTYFGLWRRCNYYVMQEDSSVNVEYSCGRYSTFFDIPTIWWQIAAVVTAVGCVLSMFVTFLAVLACCISQVMSNSLGKAMGLIQLIAGKC